jgi:two-component sensor histidine kinase
MDAILTELRNLPAPPASDPVAEANHRIANNLGLLMSMVRMQANAVARQPAPVTAADMSRALEAVAARIGTIGQLHCILSRTPFEGAISLQPHLREVSQALVTALSSPGQEVRVEHRGNDCLVPMRQVQPIVLILCEVFINAMKYAHPSGVPLTIGVDCIGGADGRLVVAVEDDGVGVPEGFDTSRGGGMGFRVIRSLASDLGAELAVMSSPLGLCFRLSLPAAAMPGGKLS